MSTEYLLPFDPQRYCVKITEGRNGPWGHKIVEKELAITGRYSRKDLHNAIDFALPLGAEVTASREGTVLAVIAGYSDYYEGDAPEIGNWVKTNFVVIEHEDKTLACYSHLKQRGVLVKEGQRVNTGRAIAIVGKGGWQKKGPYLHFQVNEPARPGELTTTTLPIEFQNYDGPLEHSQLPKVSAQELLRQ